VAGALALALAACDDGPTNPSDLLGGEWRLVNLRLPDFTVVTPSDPDDFTIQFDADGRIRVQADCNGCGGEYDLDGDSLQVSNLACTLIACPGPPVDRQFLEILVGDSTVEVDGDELTIASGEGTLRLRR
jgi:heat shock protein HslJ